MKEVGIIAKKVAKEIMVSQVGLSHLPMNLQQKSGLTRHEKLLLNAKYEKPRIAKMNEDELQKNTKGLLFKIHIITGWTLPEDKYYLSVMIEQLYKKLIEEYEEFNISEIEFAFRNFGTSIKDWGKNFNLQLFDEVMNIYKSHRATISDFEEKINLKLEITKPSDDEILNMKREVVEDRYQSFLTGKSSFVLFPPDGIETLIEDGYCEKDLYKTFFEKAKIDLSKSYKKQIEDAQINGRGNIIYQLENKLADLLEEDNSEVILMAKRMALLYCFNEFKKAGFKIIYIKENEK